MVALVDRNDARKAAIAYDLYYWPMIPGRGEYVRLVLEAAEAPYRDVARLPESECGGIGAMMAFVAGRHGHRTPFAPPFLLDGGLLISQTAEICAFLGERHGLAPRDEADRLFARSIALTTADFVNEAHDTHHPVGIEDYYEDQKSEAKRRAAGFRDKRMPKYLGWYERLIAANPAGSGFLVGADLSYADLGLFQTLAGLAYAFPRRMAALAADYPKTEALAARVAAHPAVAAYLASKRRIAFNEDGIFRYYPELDAD